MCSGAVLHVDFRKKSENSEASLQMLLLPPEARFVQAAIVRAHHPSHLQRLDLAVVVVSGG